MISRGDVTLVGFLSITKRISSLFEEMLSPHYESVRRKVKTQHSKIHTSYPSIDTFRKFIEHYKWTMTLKQTGTAYWVIIINVDRDPMIEPQHATRLSISAKYDIRLVRDDRLLLL